MGICDVHDSCALYNDEIVGLDITTRIMKSRYCLDNFSRCICYENCKEQEVSARAIYFTADCANNGTVVMH